MTRHEQIMELMASEPDSVADMLEAREAELSAALDALHLMANQYIAIGDLPDGRPKYDHMHMCAGEDALDVLEFHGWVKADQSDF